MDSIKEIYRIGHGPSSSHTMGPRYAAQLFLNEARNAHKFNIYLFGSLAATGKGHLTDTVINEIFKNYEHTIIWKPDIFIELHPNAIKFEAFDANDFIINSKMYFSVGGGAIIDEQTTLKPQTIYPLTKLDDILNWCNENGRQLWEYVVHCEGEAIFDHLDQVWQVMEKAVKRGLEAQGALPGGLKLPRKAASFKLKANSLTGPIKTRSMLFSYALAVSEENAAGGLIVTAPTCGACGVVPAVLMHFKKVYKSNKIQLLQALATAGLIGNLVKFNASISGAEVGCQGEVGTACAMASAAANQLMGGSVYQIEYAAEMGMEHHLGLTCDPVLGLVQIPCIERNAFAAERALAHNNYALLSDGKHRISFDEVVETMYQTGKDLSNNYKETSKSGLARFKALP